MEKERLEKAALTILPDKSTPGWIDTHSATERRGFIKGAEWQAERMYSEEDIALAFNEGQAYSVTGKLVDGKEWVKTHKKEWFEQFKNK